ncbi:hypothetical protein [Roseisolibacter sp. H3M3-2]|uniref:hypothetical protein n=1 Tax=Roseisolibacter sp. H3M3-2 TaxID=3031323 RepID=UPI0023D9FC6C|nr:hypothetical protein [Roseisolibacter sp. H3M3-2]MDF1505552.1 hypothetical protein [Roseisolibacter sp. H3M3-2]
MHAVLVAAVAVLPVLAAADAPPPSRPSRTAVRTLDVTASDFAFHAADTVAAGRIRLRVKNAGRELHVLEVARLADGHTAEELAAHLAARRPAPAWATFVGGPIAPPPSPGGGRAAGPADDLAVTLDLAPGRYALICPIPSPADHTPHMSKGMVRTLVVTPAPAPPRAERSPARVATPTARVVLDDYGFVLEPAWRAGRQTVRVENRAAQPHEIAVFRLAPGKRVADVLRWAAALDGPPPGALVGGTTALSRGEVASIALSLTPGTYALLCFLPDATDGRSHVQHGMTREVTVR